MSPLLSFVWRRRQQHSPQTSMPTASAPEVITTSTTPGIHHRNEMGVTIRHQNHHYISHSNGIVPPIATLTSCSSSEEESTSLTRRDSTNRHDCEQHATLITSTTTNKVVPVTPDGFKPRRSIGELRNELIHYREEHQNPQKPYRTDATGTSNATTTTPTNMGLNDKNHIRCRAIVPASTTMQQPTQPTISVSHDTSIYRQGLATLPPIPVRSWSTGGTPGTNESSLSHHPSSTGRVSFATQSSSDPMMMMTPSAESPHLEPGRTLTAVGNLVVAMEQNNSMPVVLDPPGTTPLQDISHHYGTQDSAWEYSPQEQNVETMFSPLLMHKNDRFQQNHRSIPKSAKSHRSTSSAIPQLPMIAEQQGTTTTHSSALLMTELDRERSHTNPRSRHQQDSQWIVPVYHRHHESTHPEAKLPPAASINSHVEEKQQNGYSWTVTSTPSQSSGSTTASKKKITSKNAIVVFDNDNFLLSQPQVPDGNHHRDIAAVQSDRSIQLRKARSQNRVKEELIISALERLQDDLQLVSDVENLLQLGMYCHNINPSQQTQRPAHLQQSSMYDWFVSTPMDKEGILTGFTDVKRYAILDKIDFLIHEYIDSNSLEMAETLPHPSLRDALLFCTLLVKMAIPESEKEDSSLQGTEDIGHWRFTAGLREVIGLTSLDGSATPLCDQYEGGGDASFFSLPDDDRNDNCDTPMTSNVSIGASTLTTIVRDQHGVPRPAFGTSIALNQHQQKHYNGLYLRQAIQLFTTGIQKMSTACHQLLELKGTSLNPPSLLLVADLMQKSYLQLLSINQTDLKSIVDAFEFEICVNSFIDDDDREEEICEIIDEDDAPPEIQPVKSLDSPILFAETIGFGILNASVSHNDDTTGSLDVSYDESGSSRHENVEQRTNTRSVLPKDTSQFSDNQRQQQQMGDDSESVRRKVVPLQQEPSQQNPKRSPVLTLETFFKQNNNHNKIPIQNQCYDNDHHSLTSFTTASYKSIRLEI